MSYALLKKSLELVETPYEAAVVERTASSDEIVSGRAKFSQVKAKGRSRKRKDIRGVGDVKRKHFKNIELIKEQVKKKEDIAAENLERLKRLRQKPVDVKIADLMLKRLNKPVIEKIEEKTKSQESVFTEEDFAKFEKEYFGS